MLWENVFSALSSLVVFLSFVVVVVVVVVVGWERMKKYSDEPPRHISFILSVLL